MRARASLVVLLVAATAGGCIPREPLRSGEMDQYWYLHENVWSRARPKRLSMGQQMLPSRWVLRQEESLLKSTASILGAVEVLKTAPKEIEIGVSVDHAKTVGRLLAQARAAMTDLREIARPETPKTARRWAETIASALLSVEDIARLAVAEGERPEAKPKAQQLGWSAGPMVQMIVAYLNERTGGNLLAGMDAGQVGQLRQVLAQVLLRAGFALAGKTEPAGMRQRVVQAMREAPSKAALEKSLAEMLLAGLPDAPPIGPDSPLPGLLRGVLAAAPPTFRVLEEFVSQWDRMDFLALEFAETNDQLLVAVTIQVLPKRRVRIADLFIAQPAMEFRGGSRIILLPVSPTTGETVVLFESAPAGAGTAEPKAAQPAGQIEVRFEGAIYGLVRLLALPLANAALREIRVATGRAAGRRMASVTMLMEATGDRKDPRRLIAFQDVRETRVVRRAFELFRRTQAETQSFTYLTPAYRYTYRREKTAAP